MDEEKTAYEKAQDEIIQMQASLEALKPALDVIESVKAAFPHLEIRTSCGLQVGQVPGALIHLNKLDKMSDANAIAKMLISLGYHTKGFDDYPELRRRTYDYGDIKLMCFLSWKEGAKCRFVEVGKKEEPVYKLMCDEDGIEVEANP